MNRGNLESCALPLGLGPRRLQEPGAFISTERSTAEADNVYGTLWTEFPGDIFGHVKLCLSIFSRD